MGRAPCCDKANVKKGPWSPEEDAKLKSYIEQHGTGGNWIALPQKIGLKRCGKSCRLRWLNYLRPNIKHGGFSEEEDSIICSLYISIGSRWSIIAAQLPGRTDNDIKNYWNTRLKKKLLGKPRKEHQPGGRRVGPRRDGSKDVVASFTVPNDSNQSPYWPDPPAVPAVYSNQEDGCDHATIRKLLMNLGASHAYNNVPIDMIPASSSTAMNSFADGGSAAALAGSTALEGTNMFSTELDELLYGSQMKFEGLDGLYGADNVTDGNSGGGSGTTSLESLSWNGDVRPLVYPPVVSNYPGLTQQQCNLFDGQVVHLGAQ